MVSYRKFLSVRRKRKFSQSTIIYSFYAVRVPFFCIYLSERICTIDTIFCFNYLGIINCIEKKNAVGLQYNPHRMMICVVANTNATVPVVH